MVTSIDRVSPALRRRAAWLLGAFALGLVGIAGATAALLPSVGPGAGARAAVGGPFRLQASTGGVVDSADLAGRPFIVFFGFTRCPSICPTTLAELTGLIDELHAAGQDVRAFFVSIDPERDTPAVLRDYLSSFGDGITGLSGTPEEIAKVARAYHAVVRRVPLPGGDYTMEHTAFAYLMDGRGRFVGAFDPGEGRTAALAAIRRTLASGA
ncbi:SCO family protein [Methylobacterium fujisawaense]|uniref:SCO family protein n=1 Tax=Methylobacterium fujisawaense TaxID=107400 RepID=UPI0037021452